MSLMAALAVAALWVAAARNWLEGRRHLERIKQDLNLP